MYNYAPTLGFSPCLRPAPITGRLWIHAAGKVPDESTIKAMEYVYKEIYALNGITDLNFPQHCPVSRLLEAVGSMGDEGNIMEGTGPIGALIFLNTGIDQSNKII
ncbi:hypothetical protein TSUD_301440 [Trifolium subterraneum]|uniref:Uncharacterized protein n=1 Tax=Trifolium subterraneum TaxID=3900 RepID=A0A2Z6NEU6_TRISU|nr:hypothetical protein TSUD_301440 [Trifolium subterraneum]